MKYYIIGNTKYCSDIVCSRKSAPYIGEDLEEALEMYQNFIKEVRYTNIYLICDFELYGKRFKTSSIDNDFERYVPFFVIGEWHLNKSNSIIRNDYTILSRKGFKHEFDNNLSAMRELVYCVDNHIKCDLRILYTKNKIINNRQTECEFSRLVVDSTDLIRTNKFHPVNKFRLNEVDWNSDMSRIRDSVKFQIYSMPPMSESTNNRGTVII